MKSIFCTHPDFRPFLGGVCFNSTMHKPSVVFLFVLQVIFRFVNWTCLFLLQVVLKVVWSGQFLICSCPSASISVCRSAWRKRRINQITFVWIREVCWKFYNLGLVGFSFKVLCVLIEKKLWTMSKMSQINIYPKTEERKLTTLIVERNHNLVN